MVSLILRRDPTYPKHASQPSLRRESSSIAQDFTLPVESFSLKRANSPQARILQYSPGFHPPRVLHHRIGSMLLIPGQLAKFLQLYIYDTEHEIQNRMNGIRDNNVDLQVVMKLTMMLDDYNVHAKSFRMASERLRHGGATNLKLKLIAEGNSHGRINNLPTVF
ncbi:hypothetical protein Lal_00024242 [Lupinus albus]|nr:hypothetical protein Lal_00024242 [Lupinus albus]